MNKYPKPHRSGFDHSMETRIMYEKKIDKQNVLDCLATALTDYTLFVGSPPARGGLTRAPEKSKSVNGVGFDELCC